MASGALVKLTVGGVQTGVTVVEEVDVEVNKERNIWQCKKQQRDSIGGKLKIQKKR